MITNTVDVATVHNYKEKNNYIDLLYKNDITRNMENQVTYNDIIEKQRTYISANITDTKLYVDNTYYKNAIYNMDVINDKFVNNDSGYPYYEINYSDLPDVSNYEIYINNQIQYDMDISKMSFKKNDDVLIKAKTDIQYMPILLLHNIKGDTLNCISEFIEPLPKIGFEFIKKSMVTTYYQSNDKINSQYNLTYNSKCKYMKLFNRKRI